MHTSSRFALIASFAVVATTMVGCTTNRTVSLNVPPTPVASYPAAVAPASLEYGRITNIEYFPGGTAASRINVPGALVGAVAGAVIGNQVGRAVGGRDTATVLGGAAGAAVGSQAGTPPGMVDPPYRITVQTDGGAYRSYDVPATGDLRVGDRVRIENSVIYRS
jgi:outer membrane lipoprotein SlyB